MAQRDTTNWQERNTKKTLPEYREIQKTTNWQERNTKNYKRAGDNTRKHYLSTEKYKNDKLAREITEKNIT